MSNRIRSAKFWFILASLVLVMYFFAYLPYRFLIGSTEDIALLEWCDASIKDDDFKNNPQLYNEAGGLIFVDNNTTLLIFNEYQLGYWAYQINNNNNVYTDKNVKLMNNINLWKSVKVNNKDIPYTWTPVKSFSKTFDGNGFSINNMWIKYTETAKDSGSGFISNLDRGIIKDVNFVNPGYENGCTPGRFVGFVAGKMEAGIITNCEVIFNEKTQSVNRLRFENNLDEKKAEFFWFGGIAGHISNSTITGCSVESTNINGGKVVELNLYNFLKDKKLKFVALGGIVGETQGKSEITLCKTNINISGINNSEEVFVGGVAGYINDSASITKSCNYGDINIGINQDSTTIQKAYVGGIVGFFYSSGEVSNCFNIGKIVGYCKEAPNWEKLIIMAVAGIIYIGDELKNCNGETYLSSGEVIKNAHIEAEYAKADLNAYIGSGIPKQILGIGIEKTSNKPYFITDINEAPVEITGDFLAYSKNLRGNFFISEDHNGVDIEGCIGFIDYNLTGFSLTEKYHCYVGGIVGYKSNNDSIIKNCYNNGELINEHKEKTYYFIEPRMKLYSAQWTATLHKPTFPELTYSVTESIKPWTYYDIYNDIYGFVTEKHHLGNICGNVSNKINNCFYTKNYVKNDTIDMYIKPEFDRDEIYGWSAYPLSYCLNNLDDKSKKTTSLLTYTYGDDDFDDQYYNNLLETHKIHMAGINVNLNNWKIQPFKKQNTDSAIEERNECLLDFGIRKISDYGGSTTNNINASQLDYSVWAMDSKNKINNGYPYIKEMYWKHSASDEAPASISFEYDNYNNTNKTVRLTKANLNGNIDTVEVPSTITENGITYKVTEIGSGAFAIKDSAGKYIENTNSPLKQVVLPNTITSIGNLAFYGCSNLTTINMPTKLETIKSQAFDLCKSLENVILPDGLKEIGNLAFASCHKFTEITIPNSVTRVGDRAFGWTTSLAKITAPFIGETVNSTGEKSLLGYWFGDSANATYLIEVAQRYSESDNQLKFTRYIPKTLTTIVITEGEEIKPFTFYCCTMLTEVSYPKTLTKIGAYAFDTCKGLLDVDFSNIEIIEKWAFSNCDSLRNIVLTYKLREVFDGAFAYCDNLLQVNLSYCEIKEIPTGMFYNSVKLKRVSMPDLIEKIGQRAFAGCESLTNLTLYTNLKAIEIYAFSNCDSLTIKFNGTVNQWNNTIKNNANIYTEVKIKCNDGTIQNGVLIS